LKAKGKREGKVFFPGKVVFFELRGAENNTARKVFRSPIATMEKLPDMISELMAHN
jgi:hypothetical protein